MRLCFYVIILPWLASCAHDLGQMRRDETLNAYRAAIRWEPLENATKFQTPRARELSLRKTSLNPVKISGYDVLSQSFDKEGGTLRQTVELHYYRSGDLVERTTRDEQYWRYDEDLDKWLLDSPLPRFP